MKKQGYQRWLALLMVFVMLLGNTNLSSFRFFKANETDLTESAEEVVYFNF